MMPLLIAKRGIKSGDKELILSTFAGSRMFDLG
jgi:hypothetical protein